MALVFVFLFVVAAESLIIARKMQKNAKNANQILLVFLSPDLLKKNTCAGEMSLLPLLKFQFGFNLVYFMPVVLLL